MTPPAKPRHRSGYSPEETEQVKSVCLTVAVTLGALMGELCIVGGLVPSLLIDQQIGPDPDTDDMHPGTNDLDVGLAIGLLNDEQYAEISRRLVRCPEAIRPWLRARAVHARTRIGPARSHVVPRSAPWDSLLPATRSGS